MNIIWFFAGIIIGKAVYKIDGILDEALDDVEHGRVLAEAELWAEIDAI